MCDRDCHIRPPKSRRQPHVKGLSPFFFPQRLSCTEARTNIMAFDTSRFTSMKAAAILPVPLASELDEFKHSSLG